MMGFTNFNFISIKLRPSLSSHQKKKKKRSLWDKVIKQYHDDKTSGGHTKYDKLRKKIREKYTFPGMDAYMYDYCQTCETCQMTTVQKRYTAPLTPNVPEYPGVLIQLDCTNGAGERTPRGNVAILTIIESFSGHVRLYPLEDLTAKTIAKNLLLYISIHSMPLKIITDNGPEFTAQLISELRDLLGFKHRKISPYNSKANGKVENVHRTIQTMLRAYVSKYDNDWDLLLPFVEFIYNTSPSGSNKGYSPFYIHFGRHPNLPVDVYLGAVDRPSFTTEKYIKKVRDERAELLRWMKEFKEKQAKNRKERFDKQHAKTMTTLQPGDLVRLRNEKRSGPMNQKYNFIYKGLYHESN